MTPTPLRLAVLLSGRGSNMGALARACASGMLAARVVVVIADRGGAAGIDAARALGLETATLVHAGDRGAFERVLTELRHQRIKVPRARLHRMRERYIAFQQKFSDRKPLFYRGRDKWTAIPADFQ